MQEDDVLDFGNLLARANGTALIVAGEVSALAGAVRRGSRDYLRHMVGTGAARRDYFGESDIDWDGDFAGEGIGDTFEGELASAIESGQRRDEDIRAEIGFDGDVTEIDFEVLLDSFMRDSWER
jgi:hypothetical protein